MKFIKGLIATEPLIASLGAFLCISIIAFIHSFDAFNVWLIPPFGATMVLVMAVHESPLAQPKNIFLDIFFQQHQGCLFILF